MKFVNDLKLKAKKNSPEIMLVGGIAGILVGTVWACIKSVNVKDILENHKKKVDKVKEAYKPEDKPYKKELTKAYASTAVEIGKNYILPAAVEATSIGLMIGSHNILYGRNLALTAAYTTLQDKFKEYKNIVPKEEIHKAVEAKMKDATEEEKTEAINKIDGSIYARKFDYRSRNWTPSSMYYNLLFLKNQQNYFNDLLNSRGHVFLNEVYDALDVCRDGESSPHTKAGAIVGWVKGSGGDDYIDFGIDFSCLDKYTIDDFPMDDGGKSGIYLDFNVDGVIYDLI